jgi:hypothetical protein
MTIIRPHSYRHESVVAQVIYNDIEGQPTGEVSISQTFIQVGELWYRESSIQAAVTGFRLDQLKLQDDA